MPTKRTTQQFGITLASEMAGLVKSKAAPSDYATESEVIRDSVSPLPPAPPRALQVAFKF